MTESRLARFGDALSQVGNVLLFNGNPNHSISGDAYRYNRQRWMALANWLFRDPEHCRKAHLKDVSQAWKLVSETPVNVRAEARELFTKE
jgi:hypothetical protein